MPQNRVAHYQYCASISHRSAPVTEFPYYHDDGVVVVVVVVVAPQMLFCWLLILPD
jgi:hypothetical protein